MKKFFVYFFLIIFTLNNNTVALAKWGKGELKMNTQTVHHFLEYIYGGGSEKLNLSKNKRSDPLVFSVSENGDWSNYYYCPYVEGCREDANIQHQANLGCEKGSKGAKCYTFAIGKRIVWKNGNKKMKIKKKDMKSPYVIAKKLQEAGFFDGDIESLSGINMKTGRIDNNIKITGEDKSKVVEDTSSESDIVKELTNLKLLLDSGSITKEEFDIAKKKILDSQ
tara:strand:- start:2108 stop:2776 length:669 start_codon:yes stop_codon:yes gene_type:complete